MKRKIEKYLARSQNCDESSIRYLDENRFDFSGDLDGVLYAVRDAEGSSARRGGDRSTSDRKASRKQSRRLDRDDSSSFTPGMNSHGMGGATFSQPPSFFTSNRSYYNRNSASRTLFGDKENRTPHKQADSENSDNDDMFNNIFSFSPSNSKRDKKEDTNANCEKKRNTRSKSSDAPLTELRSTFTTGRASILETPRASKKSSHKSPDINSLPLKTPDVNFDLRGFTPLSTNNKGNFAEILDSGLFSPSGLMDKDFLMEATSAIDGVKTPHASDHPRMCIANLRFGAGPSPSPFDTKQRDVAISPICKMTTQSQKRKRRSLFADSYKKRQNNGKSEGMNGLVLVTPSLSVSSSTTVMTYPLTVCSSSSTSRSILSLADISKMKPLRINSTLLKSNTIMNTRSPPDCSGMEPKQITQDSPSCSPPFSPPLNFDKLGGSILKSHKKMDAGTPAEKFFASIGGLDNFTPFKALETQDGGSLMSPTANSEYKKDVSLFTRMYYKMIFFDFLTFTASTVLNLSL